MFLFLYSFLSLKSIFLIKKVSVSRPHTVSKGEIVILQWETGEDTGSPGDENKLPQKLDKWAACAS